MWMLFVFIAGASLALSSENSAETTDGEESRKILGSSVVTSVSVIMDTGNGSKTVYTDAVGKPVGKPSSGSEVASPINLLNPDRYEFYTFDDNGDLIKRLMSLDEIKGIIATGDNDGLDFDSFTSQGYLPEKRVNEVVNTVQNVLKEEMETHKNILETKPLFDTPDVSDSWSMILPAVFGNSGEDIKPEKAKPVTHVTPDTIMIEPNMENVILSTPSRNHGVSSSPKPFDFSTPRSTSHSNDLSTTKWPVVESTANQISTTEKIITLQDVTTPKIPPLTTSTEKIKPTLNVEIFSNSKKSTTSKPTSEKIIEIKEKVTPSVEYKETTYRPTTPNIVISSNTTETKSTPVVFSLPEEIQRVTSVIGFSSVSPGSTLPTTKATTKPPSESAIYIPILAKIPTKRTTETPLTTVKKEILSSNLNANEVTSAETTQAMTSSNKISTKTTQSPPSSIEMSSAATTQQFSTWRPELSTTQESVKDKLPTLIELLSFKQDLEATTTTSDKIASTSSAVSVSENATTENLETSATKYYDQMHRTTNAGDDLSTSDSEYFGKKKNNKTTSLNLEQALTTTNKLSASELLSQLLLTTNIYEINTELAERTTNNIDLTDEAQRFETSTQEIIKTTEIKTKDDTTTEKYIPAESENNSQINTPSTDQTLIGSIEQLLSQAVVDVGDVLATYNNTDQIHDLLNSTENKVMTEVVKETATLASNLEDRNSNGKDDADTTTTTIEPIIVTEASEESNMLSNSLGSLLSQIYDGSDLGSFFTENYQSTETQSNPTIRTTDDNETFTTTTKVENTKNQITTLTPEQRFTIILNQQPTTAVSEETLPPLINITILNSETINNKIKPAKLDVSLENIYNTETGINASSPMNDSSEIYIETTFNTTNYFNEEKTTENMLSETLKMDETIHQYQNSSEITTEYDKNDDNNQTTFSLLSSSNIPLTEKEKPTTIIIIKRTEKPPTSDVTTIPNKVTHLTTDEPFTVIETSTTTNYNLNSTVSNKISAVENSTQLPEKPTIIVTINESSLNTFSDAFEKPTTKISTTSGKEPLTTEKIKENVESTTFKSQTSNINKIQRLEIASNNSTEKPDNSKPAEENNNKSGSMWTLVPTVAPHGEQPLLSNIPPSFQELIEPPVLIDLNANPMQGFGLEETTSRLDNDIFQFAQLCNELAFGFWKSVTNGLSTARSVLISPFGATSLLAMVFLGARGATSGEMNEILKLDDMVTFNPHLIFKNVSESIKADEPNSGVATSAIIRELFSDRSKGKLLPFYKERARAFYDGFVEEVSFKEIGDVIRRRTNLQVKKCTDGQISEFLKDDSIHSRSPLAGVSVNLFQTDCSQASTEGRDGELHFVVLPSIRQRRLVPIPAVVYKSGFLAGYEQSLDATAISLGTKDQTISTILVVPGQQGVAAPGDGLARLEKRLVESSFKKGAWSRLLRSLIPRPNLELQIPRFSHRSIINASLALQKMGLHELFDVDKADLRGLNGVPNELFLSDLIQINNFATCGSSSIGDTHHSEVYPANTVNIRGARYIDLHQSDLLEVPRDYHRAFHDPLHDPTYLDIPLPLRPRQARIPEVPRLKFDRPFLYFIRHNPTGLILHMGRFNPRLLP